MVDAHHERVRSDMRGHSISNLGNEARTAPTDRLKIQWNDVIRKNENLFSVAGDQVIIFFQDSGSIIGAVSSFESLKSEVARWFTECMQGSIGDKYAFTTSSHLNRPESINKILADSFVDRATHTTHRPSGATGTERAGLWAATSPVAVTGPEDVNPKPDARSLLIAEILSYRALSTGWDGSDGDRPTEVAIDEAIKFVDFIPANSKAMATVSGDGEVGFYWRRPGAFVDVSFYGDGKIYYYARIDSLQLSVKGTEPFSGRSIPKDLADAIERF